MKKTNKLRALTAFVLISLTANSQIDTNSVKEFIYNKVSKNIAAFNIRFASTTHNGAFYEPVLKRYSNGYYDPFLPDIGWKLEMKIEKEYLQYPVPQFQLYKITVDGFKYQDSAGNERKSMDVWTDKYFLVALNTQSKEIKFISGQFFLHSISSDFKVDKQDPSSFLDYLKFRFFRYQVRDITYVKKKNNRLYYDAYSDLLNRKAELIIPLNNLEEPLFKDHI